MIINNYEDERHLLLINLSRTRCNYRSIVQLSSIFIGVKLNATNMILIALLYCLVNYPSSRRDTKLFNVITCIYLFIFLNQLPNIDTYNGLELKKSE